ncbi:MAG TPA: hypothetical protein VMC09_04670 [Anaerolineales bacterium]|nr:hypothetical protein [Anaerolineales bacterium]
MSEVLENKRTNDDVDRSWRGLFCVSGILLIITAVIWTTVSHTASVLYASGYPGDPASYLELISHHQLLASVTWSLWIAADFLLFAPTVALYIVLRRNNRTLALLGGLFAMFFNIYDVCVTELNSLTLVSLSHGYASAASDAGRTLFVAAAAYGYFALPFQTVLSFATGTLGYLFWCVPMLRSIFRRATAIYGAVVMIVALIGSAAPLFPSSAVLGLCQFICIPACALWFTLVGVQLFRYGRRLPPKEANV